MYVLYVYDVTLNDSLHTYIQKVEHFLDGPLKVCRIVLQPQNQNLLPAEHRQPVQQEDDIHAQSQPDLRGRNTNRRYQWPRRDLVVIVVFKA